MAAERQALAACMLHLLNQHQQLSMHFLGSLTSSCACRCTQPGRPHSCRAASAGGAVQRRLCSHLWLLDGELPGLHAGAALVHPAIYLLTLTYRTLGHALVSQRTCQILDAGGRGSEAEASWHAKRCRSSASCCTRFLAYESTINACVGLAGRERERESLASRGREGEREEEGEEGRGAKL